MMNTEQLSEVLLEAIAAAREHPDLEQSDIANEIVAKFEGTASPTVAAKVEAQARLEKAAQHVDGLGDHESAGSVNAMIGIGLALLAAGEDSEVFYSLFSGPAGARIETFAI